MLAGVIFFTATRFACGQKSHAPASNSRHSKIQIDGRERIFLTAKTQRTPNLVLPYCAWRNDGFSILNTLLSECHFSKSKH
jgi:hypothetical protein